MSIRDWIGAVCFGLAYAALTSSRHTRGAAVNVFHFALATMASWAFFHTSRVLHRGRPDPVPLSHPLIRWPAFILLVCVVFWLAFGTPRPVGVPLSLALAALSGSIGGLISSWLRRNA